jgi:protein TonB
MRDPLSRGFSSLQPSQDSWLRRVHDNFHQLLTPARVFPSSANGAPIHFLKWERSPRVGRAQSASLLTHAAIISAVAAVAIHPPGPKHDPVPPGQKVPNYFPVTASLLESLRGHHPSEGSGRGSGHDSLPATQGNPPPRSSIQLLKPTLPLNRNPELPIPPTILDASAPRTLTLGDNIGLPWMPDQNNSSGRGKGRTIGDGPGDSIGDTPGDGMGRGSTPGFYNPGTTLPSCAYCPDPQYTDEAREAKLQGTVTLQVLVGSDGRASQIRIVRGIGLGLDERAEQVIRGWKFVPAHDAARRIVPAWVTVEAVFRLF